MSSLPWRSLQVRGTLVTRARCRLGSGARADDASRTLREDMQKLRERMAEQLGFELLVHKNPDALARGINPFDHGSNVHTHVMKTVALRQALDKYGFDAAFGGARRDEEKARAKERIFSHRDGFGQWQPKEQRPELWTLFNTRIRPGEHVRTFPTSNWPEPGI